MPFIFIAAAMLTLWENPRLCRRVIYSGLRWFSWSLGFCDVTDHIPFGCLSHLLITNLMHTQCQGLCFDTLQESHNSLYQFKYWHLSFIIQFLYIWPYVATRTTMVLPTCCLIMRAPKAGRQCLKEAPIIISKILNETIVLIMSLKWTKAIPIV